MNTSDNDIQWSFKKYAHFWFFIPDKRDQYGGDFFINSHNDMWALDWQRVKARPLAKSKWKKPEAKIVSLLNKDKAANPTHEKKYIKWIYTQTNDDFGFIKVVWNEKEIFVHSWKKYWAKNGDSVRAELTSYNGRPEAIIKEILETGSDSSATVIWELKDNWDFGFVFTKPGQDDIFVSASNYNGTVGWDTVEVRVTKVWGRRPEGVIVKKVEEKIQD